MAITDEGVKGLIHKAIADTPQSDRLALLAQRFEVRLPAGSVVQLDFLGAVPALREWVGNRTAKRPLAYRPYLPMKAFESTFNLPLDWVNNDKTGHVEQAAAGLVTRYNPQWPAACVAQLINEGETAATGIDGKPFFASDHVWGESGTIDNKLSFSATVPTLPTVYEAAQAILAAFNALATFKDDRGEAINEDMTELVVVVKAGTPLAGVVMQAVSSQKISDGLGSLDNPILGIGMKITLVVSGRITLDDRMVVVNGSDNACPFVFAENKGDFFLSSKAKGSDFEHDNLSWEYGIVAVGAAGPGRFTDAVLTIFS